MNLAPEFVGAWRRRSIAIDGGPHTESASVLWLQAPAAFADVRVPYDEAAPVDAFAGVTTYDAPALTWHHTLDWHGTFAGYDCGVVEWCGEALVERGRFERDGAPHDYEEVWERVDEGTVGAVLTTTRAMIVRVGRYSIAMRDHRRRSGGFDVRRAQFGCGTWSDVHVFGAGDELPHPPGALPGAWEAGAIVELGSSLWRVTERWG